MPALASTRPMDPVERLRQEVTCPICLEYFRDPVIIECGHSFCQACISRTWGGLTMGPCPECRVLSQGAAPRLNRALAGVVGLVKQLNLNYKRLTAPQSCPAHAERLNIYCLDDQRALCVLCTMSFRHFAHRMLPLEQAIKEGKVPQSQASTGSSLPGPTEVCCNSCLVTVTDPITPKCGHAVCRVCVARAWVCPTCKPKPKARLTEPAVMLTPVTVLDDITSAGPDLEEPEPLCEAHCSCLRGSMQRCEITKQHLPKYSVEGHQRKTVEEFFNPRVRSHSFLASKSDIRASLLKLKDKVSSESQEQKRLNRSRLVELDSTEEKKIPEKDVNYLPKRADGTRQDSATVAKEAIFKDGKCVNCGAVQQANCTPSLEDDIVYTQTYKTFRRKLSSRAFLSF